MPIKHHSEADLVVKQSETVLKHGMEVNGRYVIDHLIGRGGYGEVYQGIDQTLGREVAIKILYRQYDENSERQRKEEQRFVNEARITAQLIHSSLPITHDFGRLDCANEEFFIVSELLKGHPLSDRITISALSVTETLELMIQSASALAVAHARGVLHRDLKPSNIFCVVDDTQPTGAVFKLLDFGIAKVSADNALAGLNSDETRDSLLIGTPRYMAPERLKGEGYGAPSDLYALGIIFYKALTQSFPFRGDNVVSLLLNQMQHGPPKLELEGYTQEHLSLLQEFFEKMTRIEPEERFQTAIEVRDHAQELYHTFTQLRPSFTSDSPPVISQGGQASQIARHEVVSLESSDSEVSPVDNTEYDHLGLHSVGLASDDFFGVGVESPDEQTSAVRSTQARQLAQGEPKGEFIPHTSTPTPSSIQKVQLAPRSREATPSSLNQPTLSPNLGSDELPPFELEDELFPLESRSKSSRLLFTILSACLVIGLISYWQLSSSSSTSQDASHGLSLVEAPKHPPERSQALERAQGEPAEVELEVEQRDIPDDSNISEGELEEQATPLPKDGQRRVVSSRARSSGRKSSTKSVKQSRPRLKEKKRATKRARPRAPRVKSIKLSLRPNKPTYLVGDQIRLKVIADGATSTQAKVTVKPAHLAQVRGQTLRLKKEGKVTLTACIGETCSKKKLFIYNDIMSDLD